MKEIKKLFYTQLIVLKILYKEENYIYAVWEIIDKEVPKLKIKYQSIRDAFNELRKKGLIKNIPFSSYLKEKKTRESLGIFEITEEGMRTLEYYLKILI